MSLDIKTLLSEMQESLIRTKSLSYTDTGNRINHPMLIMYHGLKAASRSGVIHSVFSSLWGRDASNILSVRIDGNQLYDIENDSVIDETDFFDSLNEMMGKTVYQDPGHILICFVQDSADYANNIAEYENGYQWLKENGNFDDPSVYAVNITFIDESFGKAKMAKEIKTFAASHMNYEDYCLSGQFILSNKLRNGRVLSGESSKENSILAGYLMGFANNYDDGKINAFQNALFSRHGSGCYTAAYNIVEIEPGTISHASFQKMMSYIREKYAKDDSLDTVGIQEKLGIKAGAFTFANDFLRRNFRFPSAAIFEYLPQKSPMISNVGTGKWKDFREKTYGVCDSYVNGIEIFNEELCERFCAEYRNVLENNISVGQADAVLYAARVNEVLSSVSIPQTNPDMTVTAYYEAYIKARYMKKAIELAKAAIQSYYEDAAEQTKAVNEIINTYNREYNRVPGTQDEIDFYGARMGIYLNGPAGSNLVHAFSRCAGDDEKMKDTLLRTFEEFIPSDPVLAMPLSKVIGTMKAGIPGGAEQYISERLNAGIDDKIRLRSAMPVGLLHIMYMISKKDPNGGANSLYEFLKNGRETDIFLDTGDDSKAETIRIYEVKQVNLA